MTSLDKEVPIQNKTSKQTNKEQKLPLVIHRSLPRGDGTETYDPSMKNKVNK